MQWRGGKGKKVLNKPHSGLGHAVRWRKKYTRLVWLKQCGKIDWKCKVQTLYSPGIAQDCVVTVNKVSLKEEMLQILEKTKNNKISNIQIRFGSHKGTNRNNWRWSGSKQWSILVTRNIFIAIGITLIVKNASFIIGCATLVTKCVLIHVKNFIFPYIVFHLNKQ